MTEQMLMEMVHSAAMDLKTVCALFQQLVERLDNNYVSIEEAAKAINFPASRLRIMAENGSVRSISFGGKQRKRYSVNLTQLRIDLMKQGIHEFQKFSIPHTRGRKSSVDLIKNPVGKNS